MPVSNDSSICLSTSHKIETLNLNTQNEVEAWYFISQVKWKEILGFSFLGEKIKRKRKRKMRTINRCHTHTHNETSRRSGEKKRKKRTMPIETNCEFSMNFPDIHCVHLKITALISMPKQHFTIGRQSTNDKRNFSKRKI